MKKVSLGICAALLAALALAGCTSTSSSAPASAPASTPASVPASAPASVPESTSTPNAAGTSAPDSVLVNDELVDGAGVGITSYTIDIPPDFTITSEDPLVAEANDGSETIIEVLTSDATGELARLTDADVQQMVEDANLEAGGTTEIYDYKLYEIDGCPALLMKSLTPGPTGDLTEYQLRVDAGISEYTFNFVDTTGEYVDTFDAVLETIQIV